MQALVRARPLRGPRVAVLGDGGGHGAIACDVAVAAGLEVPRLSDELSAVLAGQLPHTAATRNPVDLAGGGEQDFMSYAKVTRALLESDEVDGVLMTGYFGGYSQYSEEFAGAEVDVARSDRRGGAGHRPAGGGAVDVPRHARRPRRCATAACRCTRASRRPSARSPGCAPGPSRPVRRGCPPPATDPIDARLLRQPRAARGGGHPLRARRARAHRRRGRGGGGRAGVSGGGQGRGRAAQVRRGRRADRHRGRGRAARGARGADRPARPRRALGRAHGADPRRRRADRRRPSRPALRPGGDGRARGHPRRGVRRRRGRPRADRPGHGRAAAALAARARRCSWAVAAGRRSTSPPRRRSPRASRTWRRRGPTWPRSRSTRCW